MWSWKELNRHVKNVTSPEDVTPEAAGAHPHVLTLI